MSSSDIWNRGSGARSWAWIESPKLVRLREKIGLLAEEEKTVCEWSGALSEDWMNADPQAAGVLYVDGHVRIYHGSKSKLPRRYVSRQKLSLRGITDYWVNDALGLPFFTVSSAFTTGLLAMLKDEIVPRLCRDVPGQPDMQALVEDRYLSRFVLIFDREGYSPDFFKQMWKQRIACQTYQKYPKESWPEEEFAKRRVEMPHGEMVEMELAETGPDDGREDLGTRNTPEVSQWAPDVGIEHRTTVPIQP